MTKRLTLKAIESWILEKGKPFHLVPGQVYKNNKTKLEWRCEKGHSFQMRWNDISNGNGCPYCSHRVPITIQDVEEYLLQEGCGHVLIPNQSIENNKSRLERKCPQGHIWFSKVYRILCGDGCPYRAGVIKDSIEGVTQALTDRGIPFKLLEGQTYKNSREI
jgi:hypothetical protein